MIHLFTRKKTKSVTLLLVLSAVLLSAFITTSSAKVADMVAVRINDEIILKSELDSRLSQLNKDNYLPKLDKSKLEAAILEAMIENKLIILHAKENNIYVSEREIEKMLNSIAIDNNISRAKLEEAVNASGVSFDFYKESLKEQRLISRVISREVNSKIQITDKEVRSYYEANKQYFNEVRARHILISLSPKASKTKVNAAKKKTQKILREIKRGADFAKMAEQYSEDSSASSGGDLGFFNRGEMVREFEVAAFSLEPGEVSNIVKTDFGYHIIKVEEKREGATEDISNASDSIKNFIYRNKSLRGRKKFLEELKKNAIIDIKNYKNPSPKNKI